MSGYGERMTNAKREAFRRGLRFFSMYRKGGVARFHESAEKAFEFHLSKGVNFLMYEHDPTQNRWRKFHCKYNRASMTFDVFDQGFVCREAWER